MNRDDSRVSGGETPLLTLLNPHLKPIINSNKITAYNLTHNLINSNFISNNHQK